MTRIFITRNITTESVFYKKLSFNFEVLGQSLLCLEALDFDHVPNTNWLFFYSKNGVRFFFENKNIDFKNKNFKIATIGESTAKALRKYGFQADFIGDGKPESVANTFLRRSSGESVTFIRAENSKKSVQKLLLDKMEINELIVYKNEKNDQLTLAEDINILVCTSPMNAAAFISLYKSKNLPKKAIAIGKTTEQAMMELGFQNISVAAEPNEEALARIVISSPAKNTSSPT